MKRSKLVRLESLAPAILLTLLALHATGAGAAEVDRSFHQRFEVANGARLELEHEDGQVIFTAWDQDAVEVDVRYRVRYTRVGIGRDPDLDVRFEQTGDVVRVTGKEGVSGGVGFFSRDTLEYVYEVSAPAWMELDVRGEDGDVEIKGWRGAIVLRNDDGDVRLEDLQLPRLRLDVEDGDVVIERIEGELDFELEDGDLTMRDCRGERIRIEGEDGSVTLRDCQGNFEIETEDGDVELEGIEAGKLAARTDDGRISIGLDGGLGEIDLDVSAVDGNVELRLGAGVSGAFTLTTGDGHIRVDADATDLVEEPRRVTGRLGDGAGKLLVSTDDGRITLRQESPARPRQ